MLYDPQQVVLLQVAAGYQLTLAFAPDERIESVAVGDSGAWQVTPNRLMELISSPDQALAGRVMGAMMTMRKIDIAQLEAAAGAA